MSIDQRADRRDPSRKRVAPAQRPAGGRIPRRARSGPGPLSSVQQRLWIFDQLEPEPPVFHRPSRLRMRGRLDVPVLMRVLEEIVRRHEVLRTIFVQGEDAPHSVVLPGQPFPLPFEDVSRLGAADREARLQEWERENGRPFELSQGPLFRARLTRLGDEDHLLLWNVHHIVFDAWSMSVFLREIEVLYEAFSAGDPSPLPEPTIQYSDFAEWQRNQIDGPAVRRQLDYWQKTLSGAPELFDLPFDRPRPERMSYRGASENLEVGLDLTAKLKEFARREGATLFMATVAAFEALLSSYSGRADFLVGVPTAGRSRSETEGLIGCFINTVVLRADLTGRPTFRQLLTRVRRAALEAFSNQEVPFEKVVEEFQPIRSLRHAPLFQIMANFRNVPRRTGSSSQLQVEVESMPSRIAMVDLALELEETERGLAARFTYSTDLFDSSTIRRMAEDLCTLIERAAADPDCPIGDIPLAAAADAERAQAAWNETGRPYSADRCTHELFEEQVALGPDRIAVSFGSVHVTYAELNARANILARQLRREGVGPEVPVGLCFDPSVEMLVALIGVWKAGGAWVALDPVWPSARLMLAARDSGCALVLFGADTEEIASGLHLRRFRVEPRSGEDGEDDAANLALPGDGGRLAYILYTSGSTGEPKGVAVEHHSVVNYLSWVNDSLLAGQRLRMPLVSKLSFDASLKQLLAPLLRGDPVWIVSAETAARPDSLRRALSAGGPVALNCVPALWSALLGDLRRNPLGPPLDDLQAIFLGGELLSSELVEATFAALPRIEVWNLYGPTESTANATAARVRPGTEVSIGRPIANTKAYVLNDQMRPVRVGVAGELFVGGDGVARGYWRKVESTNERFLPDPFRKPVGARMYKTGDLVRRKSDGNLEFLGRIDDQVKVRGVRVEPGEVEAILASHPAVREVAVLARGELTTGIRLVAYLAFDPTAHSSVAQLRDYLRRRVPEVMVPSAFVELERLPRLANGKVDRHSLPEPPAATASGGRNEPRTETEERLLAIWSELLQEDRIGIEESFFDRGGHSLLAAQAVTRIRQVFGVDVPLRAIFESPSVESMAQRVDAFGANLESGKATLPRAPHGRPVPLSYPQERLWFLSQLEPGNPFYNVFKAIRIEGHLDAKALARSLDAIVDRHDSLRTFFPVTDGVPRQEILQRESSVLATRDITAVPARDREAEVLRIASEESERPFDLSRGPLIRGILLRLSSEEHVFLLAIHHIVCDGWSLGIFFRELALFYESFRSGKAPELTPLALAYADFAFWQRQWLSGAVLTSRLKYWRQRLEGAPPVLELPTDRPRPPRPSYRGSRVYFAVPFELSDALRELGRREGATLFMTLLACFQVLLSRYSGSSDVVIGSPIANRSSREAEDLIGFFINTLVLRTDLSGNPSFRQLLRTVRETSLEDYAHQDIPFEKLIEELRPERTTSYPPIFQVLFALQSGPRTDLSLPGLAVTPLRADPGRTKFDLALSFRETGNGLEGTISFSTDLFDVETVRTMATHFVTLAASVVQDPDQSVGDLALLSEAERRRVL
ncbi:MAG TPA: amino acid adenylation domain-containing protein, partial [Thermoanaerobaculia bacterium]